MISNRLISSLDQTFVSTLQSLPAHAPIHDELANMHYCLTEACRARLVKTHPSTRCTTVKNR